VLPALLQLKPPAAPAAAAGAGVALGGPVDPPQMFMCPITQCIMEDPVVAADGYTYERSAIEEWFRRAAAPGQRVSAHLPHSPMTNLPLLHAQLLPNVAVRSEILEWRSAHPGA
jgi:hypothetical protein